MTDTLDADNLGNESVSVFTWLLLISLSALAVLFLKTKVSSPNVPQGYKLPPVYSTGFPLVGNLLAFVNSPLGFIRKAKEEVGGIFTMDLGVEKCTFLIGGEYHTPFFEATDVDMDQAAVYKFMTPIFGKNVVYDANLVERRQQMRALGTFLKPSKLREYPKIIAKETAEFLKTHWGEKGQVDLLPSMAELIILTASATLLGPEVRHDMFTEVSELYELLDKGLTPLSFILPYAPTEAHRKRDFARKEIGKLFSKVIAKRREQDFEGNDILQKLMNFKYKSGRKMTDDEITGLLVATLFAGQHTSSITTTWTLLFLLNDLKKNKGANFNAVMKELAHLESLHGAFSTGDTVSADVISKETNLYNCVKESIRMHPPLILLMRRVMKSATTVDGHFIPKGHRVVVSNAIAQRLPEVFENPDDWIPARWNDFDISKLSKYTFIGFGAGIHTCMGEAFAFMQIRTILTVILSTYELELVGDLPEANYEAMVVPPKGPNLVKFQQRANLDEFRSNEKIQVQITPQIQLKETHVEVNIDEETNIKYSWEEISKHDKKDDLWIVVKGKVYDVTTYLDLHQGGDKAIMKYGGKDATQAVYGPQHPGTVPTLLERYLVGLVKE